MSTAPSSDLTRPRSRFSAASRFFWAARRWPGQPPLLSSAASATGGWPAGRRGDADAAADSRRRVGARQGQSRDSRLSCLSEPAAGGTAEHDGALPPSAMKHQPSPRDEARGADDPYVNSKSTDRCLFKQQEQRSLCTGELTAIRCAEDRCVAGAERADGLEQRSSC